MWLSQLTPYPVLMPPPEVTDLELIRVSANGLRANLALLLAEKRCPPVYAQMKAIKRQIDEKIIDAARSETLEHHVQHKRRVQEFQQLAQTVEVQLAWLRGRVVVSADEVNTLVERWLLLTFMSKPESEQLIEGRKVRNGILEATAGGKRGN